MMSLLNGLKAKFDSLNLFLAEKQSVILASMYFWWLCAGIDITELILQRPQTPQEWCNFISQTVIQLLALPVLAFVSDIATGKILGYLKEIHTWQKETHDTVMAEMQILKDQVAEAKLLHEAVLEELKELKEINSELTEIIKNEKK